MADAGSKQARSGLADKIDINMTPMIDIVFQLLAFFIMTLKIVQPEVISMSACLWGLQLLPPQTKSRSHRSASASRLVAPAWGASR